MKKLVISTIIILPLILLAILLVSGAILSLITHIYVEDVEFATKDDIVIQMIDERNPNIMDIMPEVNVFPLNAKVKDLVFSSSNEDVATIDNKGIITIKYYGTTDITVASKENKYATATRTLIVTDKKVHKIEFTNRAEAPSDLYEGEEYQLSVRFYPEEADNKGIRWESSNSSVLSVVNGLVTAVGNGKATVTAYSTDNEQIFAKIDFNCHAKLDALVFEKGLFETSAKEAQFPTVTTNPEVCDVSIEYSSSNDDIASVDSKTGKITFKTAGQVTITVKATDFKMNSVEEQKVFVSTFGYFKGPLFSNTELLYNNIKDAETLDVGFIPTPTGAEKEIKEIRCYVDDAGKETEGRTDLIIYDEHTHSFKLAGELPEFNERIDVVVLATVYDASQNRLNESYEDSFVITKQEIEENINVYNDEQELVAGQINVINFEDIGQIISLRINNPDNLTVRIEEGNYYVRAQRTENNIDLTSLHVLGAETENQNLTLRIGNKSIYTLKFVIKAKAQSLSVKYGEELVAGKTYDTLLDSLTFVVTPKREDGEEVTSKVQYQINDAGEWAEATDGKATVLTATTYNIKFKCDEAEFAFSLAKETLSDYGVTPSFTTTNGVIQTLDTIDSVVEAEKQIVLTLPGNIQGNNISLKINLDKEDYLGGVGTTEEEFKNLFKLDLGEKEGWSENYLPTKQQIIINFTGTMFSEDVKLVCGAIEVTIKLVKQNIQRITFVRGEESYSTKTEDVHKGYQQVSVFAKHSDYAGTGTPVDYFKIPLNAVTNIIDGTQASVDTISWELTRYVRDNKEGVLTKQVGDTVTIYGDTEHNYKIVKDGDEYVLKDADDLEGEAVSGKGGKNDKGFIWVDAYTEQEAGYARIYFGNFKGLKETDIQNDYFGNFDEKSNWVFEAPITETTSGRDYNVYEGNSFSFLRVEAGDGAASGINCHFNFNVLDDNDVVNVFNANGYYNNSKVVLHNDLYGGKTDLSAVTKVNGNYTENENVDEEIPLKDGETKGQFEDRFIRTFDTSKLNKTLLYGNGYQVNFNAENEYKKKAFEQSKIGNYGGVTFGNVYNTTIKGRNTTDKLTEPTHGVVFIFHYSFYNYVQHYYKINPSGNLTYFRKTLISNAIKGIQPYYNGATVFFDESVVVDCVMAVCCEGSGAGQGEDFRIYFRGQNDVLNYHSANTIAAAMPNVGGVIGMMLPYEPNLPAYAEWFGNKFSPPEYDPYGKYPLEHLYVNPIVFVYCKGSGMSGEHGYKIQYWNGEKYDTVKDLKQVLSQFAHGWTYNVTADTDGAIYESQPLVVGTPAHRDMSKLFTDNRYIRLLCQYKDYKNGSFVRNTQHIQWHMASIYRDQSIHGERETHIDNLKKSLQGTQWDDGSGVSNEGVPYADISEINTSMTKLLSCAIIPRKQEI